MSIYATQAQQILDNLPAEATVGTILTATRYHSSREVAVAVAAQLRAGGGAGAGPAGPQGPQGPQGEPGPPGSVGADGPQGPQGVPGADSVVAGPAGPQGIQGAAGPQGTEGPQGPQGDTGTQGLLGPSGPQGIQGIQGPAGADSTVPGPLGPQGPAGADSTVAGPQGVQGIPGDTGAQGIQGVPGNDGAAGPEGPPGTTSWVGITDKPATFAPSVHSHPQSEVTNLTTDLAAKATTAALTAHESDTTSIHGIADTANLVFTNDSRLSDARTPVAHAHPISDVTNLQSSLDGKAAAAVVTDHVALADPHTQYQKESEKAQANGYASLDGTGKVPAAQLPAAGGGPVLCRLTSDHAISATAKTNVTGMSFVLAASTTYSFEFVLMCSANAATVGVQYALTFPGTITRFDGNLDQYITVSAKGSVNVVNDTTSPFDFNPVVSHGNVVLQNRLVGTLEVGASGGTLQLQHGSETATLTTVLRGSWGVLYQH